MKPAINSISELGTLFPLSRTLGVGLAILLASIAGPHRANAAEQIAKVQVDCSAGKKTATVPPGTTHVWWMNDRCFCTALESVLKREVSGLLSSDAPLKIFDVPSTRFNDSDTSTGTFYCYSFETIEKLRAELKRSR